MNNVEGMGRLALFGDIGGHAAPFMQALVALGMDPETWRLPDDLTVVQVGDLVHRGPDSMGVLRLADHVMVSQPHQWVQLAGNHEAQYLDLPPAFQWDEVLADEGQEILLRWWGSGQMRLACSLDTSEGSLLVTHAGLTAGMYRLLGKPSTAPEAAVAINRLPVNRPDWAWRAGCMLGGERRDLAAGPVWAEADSETYGSWHGAVANGEAVPFGQVHGHSSAFDWNRRAWKSQAALATREAFVPDRRRRHLVGEIGGRRFFGIDPGLGSFVPGPWEPLVLSGVVSRLQ